MHKNELFSMRAKFLLDVKASDASDFNNERSSHLALFMHISMALRVVYSSTYYQPLRIVTRQLVKGNGHNIYTMQHFPF